MRRFLLLVLIFALLLAGISGWILYESESLFGAPAPSLHGAARIRYAARLLLSKHTLLTPLDLYGGEQDFRVYAGESVSSIAERLCEAHLLSNSRAFQTYLVYSGLDTTIQSGDYRLSAAMTPVEIARALQDASPSQIEFTVLAGWRIEEIAASLATSGFDISPEAFLAAAKSPPIRPDFLPDSASAEGFLLPDSYLLPRETDAARLVRALLTNFTRQLTPDLREGYEAQGLSIYEAVTLASIIQREAMVDEERPLIASVFLNRLRAGMKLESDPTVQYALGYDEEMQTWWKAPLTLEDLRVDSPYNTYLYPGLPPAPISNPSIESLRAVAFPAETPYYYFRARCDNSGRHAFAETFEEHLRNACP